MSEGANFLAVKNMRDEILKVACAMFLEKTYDEVSVRDIAKTLGISVGNLTYYFRKKDDLAEAVVLDMFKRHAPTPPCGSLEEMDTWIASLEKPGDEDAFYFQDFERLSQISKKIQDIQQEVFARNLRFWWETLRMLCEAGILQPEGFAGQYDAFIHNFYLIKARWNEQSLVEAKLGVEKTNFRFRAWASIYPMLTDEGKRVFKEKIKL